MNEPVQEPLEAALQRWRNFSECLIHDFAFQKGLFSARLSINVPWGADYNIRDRVLEDPRVVHVQMSAISYVEFSTTLTDDMIKFPDEVNWGVSEIALIKCFDLGRRLVVLWESEGRLEIKASSILLVEPPLEIRLFEVERATS